MKIASYVLSWLFFAASYVIFYGLVFAFFPEEWLWNVARELYKGFIDEGTWNDIYMSVVLVLSLLINIIFMFLLLSVIRYVKRKRSL
ncbi:hypothetical protein LMA04_16850 [Pseudescherichia vulneris]|uniref:hypothetical protein n=1 Tax=Pseudescherichia vulneris TaxID=566 RepID=UPI00227BAD13|nr:hypothetical protein [Pseudescherichia vulneris]WAH51754.1 hypothetical protein LMA04_16850 [Pseudescherichia vulneris]